MLNDIVVVVVGGGGLLGRTFVRAVAENGGIAVAADLDIKAAAAIAEDVGLANPGRAVASAIDITDEASINRLLSDVQARHGRIDAVVNAAYPRNRNYGRKLEDVAYEDFCENLNLHLGGYFLVARQFGVYFQNQSGGNIVNVASIYGTMAPRFEVYGGTPMTMPVEYAAIKSGIIHLTRYFAQYFKRAGVRVNCISPGGISDGQPESFLARYGAYCGKKGMLDSSDISGTLLFLLSDVSKYVTGQNVIVDDGFSL